MIESFWKSSATNDPINPENTKASFWIRMFAAKRLVFPTPLRKCSPFFFFTRKHANRALMITQKGALKRKQQFEDVVSAHHGNSQALKVVQGVFGVWLNQHKRRNERFPSP